MSERKLYLARVTVEAYIYAESEEEARNKAHDALHAEMGASILSLDADVSLVDPGDAIADGWDETCLVYHAERGDIPLGEVWPGGGDGGIYG